MADPVRAPIHLSQADLTAIQNAFNQHRYPDAYRIVAAALTRAGA